MKATLTFNLPDEQREFNCAINGIKYRQLLVELWNEFRAHYNYSEKQETTWEEARQLLMDTFNENQVYFDEL